MRTPHLLLGVAGAALFAAGAYLARTSSATPAPVAKVVTTPSGRTFVAAPPAAPRTPSALVADLHDADARVRRTAVAEVDDPQLLLEASRDPDLGVGLRATAALGKLYAQGAIPARELVVRIDDHRLDEKVRAMAANGLGIVPSPEGAAQLAKMASGDVLERREAAALLQHQDASAAVPAELPLLADADEYVREAARASLVHLARGRDFGDDANAWRAWWQTRQR